MQDLYLRFIRPNAPPQHAVTVSRFAIVFMALLAGLFATFVHNIAAVWQFLVTLGAGLGSVSAVRWYWSRVTPQAEIAAIVVTTFTAVFLQVACSSQIFGGPNPFFLFEISGWLQILLIAGISLLTWIPVSLWGPQMTLTRWLILQKRFNLQAQVGINFAWRIVPKVWVLLLLNYALALSSCTVPYLASAILCSDAILVAVLFCYSPSLQQPFCGTLSEVTMVGNRERVRDRYEFTFFFWPNRSFGSS